MKNSANPSLRRGVIRGLLAEVLSTTLPRVRENDAVGLVDAQGCMGMGDTGRPSGRMKKRRCARSQWPWRAPLATECVGDACTRRTPSGRSRMLLVNQTIASASYCVLLLLVCLVGCGGSRVQFDESGLGSNTGECAGPLRFEEAELEALVRYQIGPAHGEIAPEDVLHIEELLAPELGIEKLDGIGCLTNLTVLELQSNRIHDLAPLARLSALRTLNLSTNQGIADLAPLATLTSLEWLNVREQSCK